MMVRGIVVEKMGERISFFVGCCRYVGWFVSEWYRNSDMFSLADLFHWSFGFATVFS